MNKYWTYLVVAAIVAVVAFIAAANGVFASKAEAFQVPQGPEYICHATPADTAANGWNKISPSIPQLVGHISQHDADIIPPFGIYGGKNWDSEGQLVWDNDCVQPEPPKDYCDTLEGVQAEDEDCPKEECPDGYHEVPYDHNYEVKLDVDWDYELVCEPDEEEPRGGGTPPSFAGSSTDAPSCPNGETTNVVANPHVLRAGESATVNFFITEGDSANIFYSEVGQPHWQHAVANVKPNSENFVSFVIHGLDPNLGYDFGIQQVKGCGGGKTTAVIVDGPAVQLFQLSYYE